mmetsp:Transcript_7635/g.33673  ORF Transcript_7635/g.33673 Transcript_7635/m.33673 type:complete len:241 (-) Transcript_7635:310-1032(-)
MLGDAAPREHRGARLHGAPRHARRRVERHPRRPRPRRRPGVLPGPRGSGGRVVDRATRGVQGGPPAAGVAAGAPVDRADLLGAPRVRLPQLSHPGGVRASRQPRQGDGGRLEARHRRGRARGRDVSVLAAHRIRRGPSPRPRSHRHAHRGANIRVCHDPGGPRRGHADPPLRPRGKTRPAPRLLRRRRQKPEILRPARRDGAHVPQRRGERGRDGVSQARRVDRTGRHGRSRSIVVERFE